jgi:hypothetical protein
MKRPFGMFDLAKNERRVVLIVIFLLITVAFVKYERRVHRPSIQPPTTPSPTVGEHRHQM